MHGSAAQTEHTSVPAVLFRQSKLAGRRVWGPETKIQIKQQNKWTLCQVERLCVHPEPPQALWHQSAALSLIATKSATSDFTAQNCNCQVNTLVHLMATQHAEGMIYTRYKHTSLDLTSRADHRQNVQQQMRLTV